MAVLRVLVWVFAALFLITVHVRFWRSRYRLVLGAEATFYARTDDGWRLAIHRYGGGEGEPVVLCHGLGANGFNMDLGSRLTLARYLAARGFDVWSLELRGVGFSRWRDSGREATRSWSFDDHALRDVPAAISRVLEETGHRQVHWVGHSLGGMVIYAYLAARGDRRVASICTIGSPAAFSRDGWLHRLEPLVRLLSWLPTIRTSAFIGASIPFYQSYPLSYVTHNGRNVATRDVRRAMANLVEPISRRTLGQVALWLRTGRLVSRDGRIDYGELMKRIAVPACVIAGTDDPLGRLDWVRAGYDALGSALKELHIVGREHGADTDYGHGDLLVGRSAPEDVYPLVRRWLADRRIGRARPAGRVAAVLSSGVRRALDRAPTDLELEPPTSRALVTRVNPYDPYTRRRRSRWRRRGGRTPLTAPASAAFVTRSA